MKGVTHRMWKWSDPETLQILRKALAVSDVLIADGHHRYETAWSYAEERQAANRAKSSRRARLSGGQAYRYVLIFLCSLVDPGLVIHPTHRAVRLTATPEEWGKLIAPHSTMQRVS